MAEKLNEQVDVATPVETTDRGLFEFKNKDEEGKPIKEETLAPEFDQKVQISDPVEIEEAQENKDVGNVDILPRSYSSSSSSSDEGDDEETKQRKKEKKEKKGLKEKLMEKLPGHKDDEVVEEPHVQEVVYAEPPHQEEEPEKKGFLDKIKEKLPGQSKTDDHHEEAVPVAAEPVVEGQDDKKGLLDKIKDKIPGLSSSKTGDDKNDHDDK